MLKGEINVMLLIYSSRDYRFNHFLKFEEIATNLY